MLVEMVTTSAVNFTVAVDVAAGFCCGDTAAWKEVVWVRLRESVSFVINDLLRYGIKSIRQYKTTKIQ